MTAMTSDRLAQVLAKLSLNYGRNFDGPAEAAGMLDMWQTGIGGCAWEDVEAAQNELLLDADVARMPTVAEFRRRVIECNRRRRRHAADSPHGDVPGCLTCSDSGWVDQGTTSDGYWYVTPCPQGCVPPATNRVRRAVSKGRKRTQTEQQLALGQPASLREAIAATARMVGDHDPSPGALDEPF